MLHKLSSFEYLFNSLLNIVSLNHSSNISRVNIKVYSRMQLDFILAMKDETLGRHVCWIEDHEGCQDIAVRKSFLHMGNEAARIYSCVLHEHKKLWSTRFPDVAFFGISHCCSLFLEEPFTTPFSVFLFLFAVNLVKSIFQNTEVWNWSARKTETCLDVKSKPFDWVLKQCSIQQHSADHMSRMQFIRVSHGFPCYLFYFKLK